MLRLLFLLLKTPRPWVQICAFESAGTLASVLILLFLLSLERLCGDAGLRGMAHTWCSRGTQGAWHRRVGHMCVPRPTAQPADLPPPWQGSSGHPSAC